MATYSETYNLGMIPQGSRVVVIVSKGASPTVLPEAIPVENVVGKTQGAALEHMSRHGIKSTVIYDYHRTAQKGLVIAQYPRAGSDLTTTNNSIIIVSSGQALQEKTPVIVPDLVGKDEVEALALLEAAGLAPQVMYEYSSEYAEGTVAAQLPDRTTYASGAPKRDTLSWLMIALLAIVLIVGGYFLTQTAGKAIQARRDEISVPNVVGKTLKDATKELIDKKLTVGEVTETTVKDEKSVGTVLSTDPTPGKKVKPGSAVDLVIGALGDEGDLVEVPAVVGMNKADAEKLLKAKGFKVEIAEELNSDKSAGTVLKQEPSAGKKLAKGSMVSITVAAAEDAQTVDVPNVVGLTLNAANTAVKSAGLTATTSKSFSDTVAKGLIISQNPAAGNKVSPGSSVALVISDGKEVALILVPNVVGKTLDQATATLIDAGFDVTTTGGEGQSGSSVVIGQNPTAGSSAKSGSTVTLTLEP